MKNTNTDKDKKVTFVGQVYRNVYDSDSFKVYAMTVDTSVYPDIKKNKYGNVSIFGDIPVLVCGVDYEITGIETANKYGKGYQIINIRRDTPTDSYAFLSEILTPNQAKTLYDNYPDIIERVKNNRLDDVDLKKLKGIGEYTFKVIKEKIIDNFCLSDLVAEFKGMLSLTTIKKLYKTYSSVETIKAKLSADPYKCLCRLSGVGFKTADAILLDMEKQSIQAVDNGDYFPVTFIADLKTSKERCLACILYLLEQNENEGHTKANLATIRSEVIKTTPECVDQFSEAILSDDVYYNKDTSEIALAQTYKTEKEVAEAVKISLSISQPEWDFDTSIYRTVNGVELSDEQMSSLDNICKYNISILNGPAGTGKSFSTKAIINMLQDNGKSFVLFSPTGKAAKILASYTECSASTIHRGLCYNPAGHTFDVIDENGNLVFDSQGKIKIYHTPWGYNKYHKLKTDIVIIDEFSMVDVFLFKHVIDAINIKETKLLLIGDNAQLCSVGCGNLLHDFMQSQMIPTTTLSHVFRYNEGGLMKVATDVRFCKPYLSAGNKNKLTTFGENKDYSFVDLPSDVIPVNAVALYKKLLGKNYTINDIQVLTAKNVGDCGTETLNNMIQQVANPNYGSERCMKYGNTTYYEGDLVIQKANNYKAKIYNDNKWDDDLSESETAFIANGETGIVNQIGNSFILIDFDGIIVKYSKDDLQSISLGYSISIHKSQGSSIKAVILLTPQSHMFMLNSNLIYVGLTRMKEVCYHLGTLNSVNTAVTKKANLTRNTFMQDLLKFSDSPNITI